MPSSNDDLKVTSTSLYCLRENDKIMTYIYIIRTNGKAKVYQRMAFKAEINGGKPKENERNV